MLRRFAACAATTIAVLAGCSRDDAASSSVPPVTLGTARPLTQGPATADHRYAVGLCLDGSPGNCTSGTCSGTLIAPNLVLTARHCIEHPTNQPSLCGTDTFAARFVSQIFVTTGPSLLQSTTGWHDVDTIALPQTKDACADDIAVLFLKDNVPASEAEPADVLAFGSMSDHTRYSTELAIIGFGISDPAVASSFGTRRILEHVPVTCIEDDPTFAGGFCEAADVQVLPDGGTAKLLDAKKNFSASWGACSGDSGSGAFEQWSLDRQKPLVMGVLSRGGAEGHVCFQLAYTRTDAWKDFLVANAKTAAQKGGYPVPAWALGPTAPVQAGRAVPAIDAGTDAPSAGELGAPCERASDCRSNACVAIGEGSAQCVERCGEGGTCAADAICTTVQDTPVCLQAVVTNGAAPAAPASSSGCSVGARGAGATSSGLVVLALAALARRRRAR